MGVNVGKSISKKDAYELVELEEFVKNDKGCWLRFLKLPPKADAGAGGKAPAKGAKGGAAPTDDAKPVVGRAWPLKNFESKI